MHHCYKARKKPITKSFFAFTLVEVIVTIVIIGVIAALTIPTVVKNYQERQTVTMLKEDYSIFARAFNMAQAKYGPATSWNWGEEYYSETSEESLSWADKYLFSFLKGQKNYVYKDKFYVNNIARNKSTAKRSYAFMMENGTGVDVRLGGNKYAHQINNDYWCEIVFDINGNKKPNVYGKDIFLVYLYAKSGLSSALGHSWHISTARGESIYGRDWVIERCSNNTGGSICLDLIKNNNWQIPDDYPW